MPGKPKEKEDPEKKKPETGDRSSWAEDQKEKDYYYDDSHGYEVFDPEREQDQEEEDPTAWN
jgi:hypothetical protein